MLHIHYKKNSFQLLCREVLHSMKVYYSLKLSTARTILQSSLKRIMNKNVEVCGNADLKRSMRGYLDMLFLLGEENTVCGLLTHILKAIVLA